MRNDFDRPGQVELRGRVLGWLWQEFVAADPGVVDVLEGPRRLATEPPTRRRRPEMFQATEHRKPPAWTAALANWRRARGPFRAGRTPATDDLR